MFLVPMSRSASDLARCFDRLFGAPLDHRLAADAPAQSGVARSPALDVAESDQAYTVTLELPGVAKDEVKVSIEGRQVTIEARASASVERKDDDRVIYRERAESSYARSLTLPAEVDSERSIARLDCGVLKLELIKRSPKSTARIAIN